MVSLFKDVKSPQPIAHANHLAVFKFIKENEENRKKVLALRDSPNYKSQKLMRPCVAWAGVFEKRANSAIKEFSGLMYFDIDTAVAKSELVTIPEVLSAWESLSGRGWGFVIATNVSSSESFISTYNSFIDKYDLPIDKLKDVARVNFLSADPKLYYNESAKLFSAVEGKKDAEVRPERTFNFLDLVDSEARWSHACNKALDSATQKGLDYLPGQRHNFTVAFFTRTNFYGVPYDYAWNWLNQQYFLSEHSAKTSQDIYRRYYDNFNRVQRLT